MKSLLNCLFRRAVLIGKLGKLNLENSSAAN